MFCLFCEVICCWGFFSFVISCVLRERVKGLIAAAENPRFVSVELGFFVCSADLIACELTKDVSLRDVHNESRDVITAQKESYQSNVAVNHARRTRVLFIIA